MAANIGRRAAIYARFSTDLQSDRSVDDQHDLCAAFARAQGFEVVGRYDDRARSGTTTFGRDGLSRLIHDARAGRFDAVIVEALDRLSRDQEDLAGIHKRLSFLSIDIVAVHDGRADALQVGIRGLVSSLWIADLKHKIRRGMSGRVRDGRAAGGRAYGYRPTPGDPGRPIIRDDEAAIIRRVFAEFIAGRTPRDIAADLNRDGIPAPRGAKWAASVIVGSGRRGHGVLRNPIYAGRLVWNRVRMVRDPDTGRRVSRPNPPGEWQTADAPGLAIVDPATWQAAQDRLDGRSHGPRHEPYRRRKSLLSGLLRCARCGGGMSLHDRRGDAVRVRCTTNKESGSCGNTRRYRMDLIERVVIDGVAARLSDPAAMEAYVRAYQDERRAETAARARLERDAQAARDKIDRMARMLVDGRVPEDFFDAEMPQARAELAALQARLDAAPPPHVVALHPAAIASYRDALAGLGDILRVPDAADGGRDLVEAFRGLIDRVVIHDAPDGGVDAEVIGHLGPLLSTAPPDWGGKMVAEEGLSPIPPIMWGRFAI